MQKAKQGWGLVLGVGALFLVCIAILGGGVAQVFIPALPGSRQPIIVEVHRGQGPHEVAALLEKQGAIKSANQLWWLGRLTRQWKRLKAGEYQVFAGQTPIEVLAIVTSGVSMAHPVTVHEGDNLYQVAQAIEDKGLAKSEQVIELCHNAEFIASLGLDQLPVNSLEGYLFPDTYNFNRTMNAEEMIRMMVKRTLNEWKPEMESAAQAAGFTRHELLTLASIVEKETGAPEERPHISSVFYNRLKKKMRLQSDPTTIYGIWEKYEGNLHKSDLLRETPYNTYAIAALPIGPIANPGKAAIYAALHPMDSGDFYFVSHNDGTHEFTKTYEAHRQAVVKFQLSTSAREGKSWRDLNKRDKSVAQ